MTTISPNESIVPIALSAADTSVRFCQSVGREPLPDTNEVSPGSEVTDQSPKFVITVVHRCG